MITRVWQGWTSKLNADRYERLLKEEVFPSIGARKIHGLSKIDLYRRERDTDVEFMTVMWFSSPDVVRAFAGEDAEAAYVPQKAREILDGFEARARHFSVAEERAFNE
jgi:hypothetical protein